IRRDHLDVRNRNPVLAADRPGKAGEVSLRGERDPATQHHEHQHQPRPRFFHGLPPENLTGWTVRLAETRVAITTDSFVRSQEIFHMTRSAQTRLHVADIVDSEQAEPDIV